MANVCPVLFLPAEQNVRKSRVIGSRVVETGVDLDLDLQNLRRVAGAIRDKIENRCIRSSAAKRKQTRCQNFLRNVCDKLSQERETRRATYCPSKPFSRDGRVGRATDTPMGGK